MRSQGFQLLIKMEFGKPSDAVPPRTMRLGPDQPWENENRYDIITIETAPMLFEQRVLNDAAVV